RRPRVLASPRRGQRTAQPGRPRRRPDAAAAAQGAAGRAGREAAMTRYGTAATPDRPEFEVRVGGTRLDPLVQRDVVEVDVAEEVGRHARAVLLLQNWDADTRTVRHSDDGPFPPGTDVEVLLGYHSALEPVFDGVVVAVTAHFPA